MPKPICPNCKGKTIRTTSKEHICIACGYRWEKTDYTKETTKRG
jgi:ribosomal protein L37AE/L43A